ncbi:MAG: aspartate/glutamate racemase family protein [Candidatus Aminicenantes bacterium]|nr:aspartate/glutamate racemase family protein [Candidatus Aminicenantes bacterium]
MKTIGLLGGMTWHSTVSYFRAINEETATRLGGLHSAKVVLYSVEFAEMERFQKEGRWDEAGEVLAGAARAVEAAGADFLLIGTNTMHKVAPRVEAAISIPLVHIADAAAEELKTRGLNKAGLLGTRFTMEEDFFSGRLKKRHGLDTLVPGPEDRTLVHRVIYEELGLGVVRDESRTAYLDVIGRLRDRGAQAVILGCTEIALLVRQEHTDVPLLDTTTLHARKAVDLALA